MERVVLHVHLLFHHLVNILMILQIRTMVAFGYEWASLVAQMVKNLPAMWETWVQSLGWEDPLEKGMTDWEHQDLSGVM